MEARELIPLNPRDYLILFALDAGERHGYGIVKEVERESGGQVRLDPANLYRSIKRLRRDGLVEEAERRAVKPSSGRLPDEGSSGRRRFYAITEFGRQVLALEAARLAALADAARATGLIPDTGTSA